MNDRDEENHLDALAYLDRVMEGAVFSGLLAVVGCVAWVVWEAVT